MQGYSRNLSYGIYNEKTKGFIGIRNKFRQDYLFTEYHYDNGPPFGTVFPKKELGKIPDNLELKESLEWEIISLKAVKIYKEAKSKKYTTAKIVS